MFLDPDLDSKILEKNPGRCFPKVHFFGHNCQPQNLDVQTGALKMQIFPVFLNKLKHKIASLG